MVDTNKILRNIILVFVVLIAMKSIIGAGMFKSDRYTGTGYSVKLPINWKMTKDAGDVGLFMTKYVSMGTVLFETPETIKDTHIPVATITIVEAKLSTPAWIDDLFPMVMEGLPQLGARIRDRGEIKMDGQIAKWILFQNKGSPALNLEFYVADEKNGIYKIRYSAQPSAFTKYRKDFEALRESFLFSTALW